MAPTIRPARLDETGLLREIEREAGQMFRAVGLGRIADREPSAEEFIVSILRYGVALCAVDASDQPVGFGLAGRLDDALHLYELSVIPDFGGRGTGSALLREIELAASAIDIRALTLSTFLDVPWNRPFYERRGFAEVVPEDWTPAFHLLHAAERLAGLPMDRRVFMRKELA